MWRTSAPLTLITPAAPSPCAMRAIVSIAMVCESAQASPSLAAIPGRLYFDGTWTRDVHYGDSRETRFSASYTLDTKSKWLGLHRLAASVSRTVVNDRRANSWLVLAGRPYSTDPSNANNRVIVRNYLTEGNYDTYRAGDWRSLVGS